MINDLKTQVISEYCKAILILLIFSIFSDRQTFIKVLKSKTASIFSDIREWIGWIHSFLAKRLTVMSEVMVIKMPMKFGNRPCRKTSALLFVWNQYILNDETLSKRDFTTQLYILHEGSSYIMCLHVWSVWLHSSSWRISKKAHQ